MTTRTIAAGSRRRRTARPRRLREASDSGGRVQRRADGRGLELRDAVAHAHARRGGGPDRSSEASRPGPVSRTQMEKSALAAGYKKADVEDYLAENTGNETVYTLKLSEDFLVVFAGVRRRLGRGGLGRPYEVVDDRTFTAGEPPCGPKTYAYTLRGDVLSVKVRANDCPGPDGKVPVGERIAQATLYETVDFTRVA